MTMPFDEERRWPRQRQIGLSTLNFIRARPARRMGKLAGRSIDAAFGLLDRAMTFSRDPERIARQGVARLALLALPKSIRDAVALARGISGLVRQR